MVVDRTKTIRKLVSFPREMLPEIEDFRFDQRIASESEAIRRLVRMGLEVAATKAKRRKVVKGDD